ncbi:MAG: HAD-IC family P-type ATPase, partial [Eubacteriales bacterium]|nr:HAD-IC family P-type ATPase [Eubacteriales bacterium]
MLFQVLHTSSSRMRVHLAAASLTPNQADVLEYFVRKSPCVEKARVYERTGDMVVFFLPGMEEQAKERISEADFDDEKQKLMVPESTGREIERKYEEKLTFTVLGHFFRKLFFPVPLRTAWTVVTSIRYFKMGFDSLRKGKLEVPVLDASAIGASMLTGDFDTAASVMFLLHVGEILEEWTHKKSVDDLASTMSLRVDHVWKRTADGDNLVPVSEIQAGDRIVVRMSEVIPMDGIVTEGEATVNQSSMTGESVPILKNADSLVYAGTVVEEGSICCRVTKVSGSGRYDQIVRMIEDSEKLKSATETRAFHLADRLVPWSLGGTIVTWLLTRNITKALSFLMVDFSCALKLSMPLTVLSAIREAGERDITVKGGKFLEAVALSDTIVFDKTGPLTYATPEVVKIVPF